MLSSASNFKSVDKSRCSIWCRRYLGYPCTKEVLSSNTKEGLYFFSTTKILYVNNMSTNQKKTTVQNCIVKFILVKLCKDFIEGKEL